MTILELREKRNKGMGSRKGSLKQSAKGRTSVPEDAAAHAEMGRQLDYGSEIERMEADGGYGRELSSPRQSRLLESLNGDKLKSGRASDDTRRRFKRSHEFQTGVHDGVDANERVSPEEYDNRLIDTLTEENIMRKARSHHHYQR